MSRSVHVVPHTHWDREWYDPFPTFRIRLVDLLDDLLPRLDEGDGLAHFQLDGQMAVIDDYLLVRPDAADRLRRLNTSGRLSMGPWYVLPDEFLVSGETLVRDLQLGIRRAEQLGGAMEVGYLPDMFGHVAAMPQLLALFGMEHAVVWRGVPSTIQAPAFRWRAPDGTEVRAEYLPSGYGNGSDMPEDAGTLGERIDLFAKLQGGLVGERILWMAGMDHEVPPAHLAGVVAELDRGDEWSIAVGSLANYLAEVSGDRDALPVHDGELRSGARANLLMGVASNRVDVKVAAARAERSLERLAEPLVSLWAEEPARWTSLLDLAWLEVIRNAAHDSICACSHDEVVDAVLHRYAEALRTAEGVAQHATADAAGRMVESGAHLLNPTARPRAEVIDVTVPATGEPTDLVQVLHEHPAQEELYRVGAAEAPIVLGRDLIFEFPETVAVRLDDGEGPDGRTVTAHLLPTDEPGTYSPADALGELGRRCALDPDLTMITVLHRAEPSRRVLTVSPTVPGFGWARWEPTPAEHPVGPVGDLGLANGLVTVEVDATDGTFAIDGLGGFGRLVDDGDAGDTYNWSPPEHDVVVDRPVEVSVERTEAGPMRGVVVIDATYVIPERVERRDDQTWERIGEIRQQVRTTVEVRAEAAFVRVLTELDHRARDHRLRVHLPLPERANRSRAECAYALVERPLWAEGGPNEWGLPTFPSRRFVSAGGLTVTHEGLCEYELVALDGEAEAPETTAGELALTLVRATGWLSRGPMRSRPLPAGPELALEGAQVRKPLALRYALSTTPIDPYELAERAWAPLLTVQADGGGDLPASGSHLTVRGVEVDAVLRQPGADGRGDGDGRGHGDGRGGALVVRAHEPHGRDGELVIEGRTGTIVDLRGRELERFDGRAALRPHQIITVRLDD